MDGILPNLLAQNGFSDDQPMMMINIKGIKRKKHSSSIHPPYFSRYLQQVLSRLLFQYKKGRIVPIVFVNLHYTIQHPL